MTLDLHTRTVFVDPRVVTSADSVLELTKVNTPSLAFHFTWRFLDLCQLIEALVLHDHLTITAIDVLEYPWTNSPFIAPFLQAGIVDVVVHSAPSVVQF